MFDAIVLVPYGAKTPQDCRLVGVVPHEVQARLTEFAPAVRILIEAHAHLKVPGWYWGARPATPEEVATFLPPALKNPQA